MQQKCDDSTEDIFKTVLYRQIQYTSFYAFWHYYLHLCPTLDENR